MIDKIVLSIAGSEAPTRRVNGIDVPVRDNHPLLRQLRDDRRVVLGDPKKLERFGPMQEIRLRLPRSAHSLRTSIYVADTAAPWGLRLIINPHPALGFWVYHDLIHHLAGNIVDFSTTPVSRFDLAFDNFEQELHSIRQYLTFDRRTRKYRQHCNQHGEVQTIELGSLASSKIVKIYNKYAEIEARWWNPLPDYSRNTRETDVLMEGEEHYLPGNFVSNPCTRFECVYQKQHGEKHTDVSSYYDLIPYVGGLLQPLTNERQNPFDKLRIHQVEQLQTACNPVAAITRDRTVTVWKAVGLHQVLFDARLKWHSGLAATREAAQSLFRLHPSRPTNFNDSLRIFPGTNGDLLERLKTSLRGNFGLSGNVGRERLGYYSQPDIAIPDQPRHSFEEIHALFAGLHENIATNRSRRRAEAPA